MSSGPYNVGVIGYGMSAKVFHIPLIEHIPELKLYAVVQRNPKPEDNAEKDHPGIKSYRSTEDMVKDDGLHVVVVTTVPDTHFELAKLALDSGKHGESSFLSVRSRQSLDLSSRRGLSSSRLHLKYLDTACKGTNKIQSLSKSPSHPPQAKQTNSSP